MVKGKVSRLSLGGVDVAWRHAWTDIYAILYELWSKLLVTPSMTPTVVPYTAHFKEFRSLDYSSYHRIPCPRAQ